MDERVGGRMAGCVDGWMNTCLAGYQAGDEARRKIVNTKAMPMPSADCKV